ncbi:MAG: acyltransferase [Saprospiraceae bacterium]|nr:acyltransferase [Saprospiraceae bacterium]
MKNLLLYFIRKRNPDFVIDNAISSRFLLGYMFTLAIKVIRGSKLLFMGRNPKGMILSSRVSITYLSKIKWGKFLKLGKNVSLSGLGKEGIIFGDNVSIGDYSQIIVATTLQNIGKGIQIGHHVGIGEFAYLGGAGGLSIGDDCIIGQYFSCHPENHNFRNGDSLIRLQGVQRQGIIIGKNCWIGSKVTILDGVTIGDGCVIAAGAVVNRSFPDNSIIGGVPAKTIGQRCPDISFHKIKNIA